MRSTLVGVFENHEDANRARDELLRNGFTDADVSVRAATPGDGDAGTYRDTRDVGERARLSRDVDDNTEAGIGETIGDWFRSLFGIDDDDVGVYSEAVRRGNSVVTVHASSEDRVDRATNILEDFGSIDIDERADLWQSQGWSRASSTSRPGDSAASRVPPAAPLGSAAASAGAMGAASSRPVGGTTGTDRPVGGTTDTERRHSGGTTGAAGKPYGAAGTPDGSSDELHAGETRKIPVIEEELRVGKRIVGRRGLRVYTHMVEEPVEESVRLREEHAKVERRDVDRPATRADYDAAKKGSVHVRESAEEPVVSKSARVVGEVDVGKTAEEHEKTVRDKVRHTDVDVEKFDQPNRPKSQPQPNHPRGAGRAH